VFTIDRIQCSRSTGSRTTEALLPARIPGCRAQRAVVPVSRPGLYALMQINTLSSVLRYGRPWLSGRNTSLGHMPQ